MNLLPIENIQVTLSHIISSFVGAFQRPAKIVERSISKEVKVNHHGFSNDEIQIFIKGQILIVEGLKFSKKENRICHSFREYCTIENGYDFKPSSIKHDEKNLTFTIVRER